MSQELNVNNFNGFMQILDLLKGLNAEEYSLVQSNQMMWCSFSHKSSQWTKTGAVLSIAAASSVWWSYN